MSFWFPVKETNNDERRKRRDVLRYMHTEAVKYHDDTKHEDRIHGAVFEIHIFFNSLDVAKSELSHNERAEAIPEQDERHWERKSKSPEYAIDWKSRIDNFQKEKLAQIRLSATK